jgi:hypothetical protein
VSIHLAQPDAHGRTWTAADYATRNARLATLGVVLRQRMPTAHGQNPTNGKQQSGHRQAC